MTVLVKYEWKLFLRDPAATLVVLVLPVGMVALFGAIMAPDNGQDGIETFFPSAAIALGLAQLGMNLLPTTMASYREKGVLRRMAATPVHPARLLGAQLAVGVALAVISMALVVVVGVAGFGFDLPARVPAFLLSFVLGVMSLFAVGLLVAALAPSGRVATGIGIGLFFLSIVFGGIFMPAESLPPFMVSVGDYTPLGAFMQSLRASWAGAWPEPPHLAVMAAVVLVSSLLSAKMFRWE
ncbi:ABC transporter permease [Spongiactinospora sp. TRM90649]|uniref:ABC transporter permease n=1 Tax=Spongiactinospora sp. TRM90649 TaxID=3031114 RepID=UPI0023F84C56|nr:ABC transporter permease [Spongiactinospora sp. TRM90649]MDF5753353.1 ABC transporter permease [Spongiactinospora sp. TRM90649]